MGKDFDALARKVKENIKQYSTVLITGNIGLGKSELLSLLEKTIAQTDEVVGKHSDTCTQMPQCSVKLADADVLGQYILKYVMCGKCNSWKDEFAPYKYIIIDDFEKLREKTTTQETLFSLFCRREKHIVIFSKDAIEGKGYIDEIVKYFRGGMHIHLDDPIVEKTTGLTDALCYTVGLPDGTKEYVVELPDSPNNTCVLDLFLKSLTFVRENEEFSAATLQRYLKCSYGAVCKVLDALCNLCVILKHKETGEKCTLKYKRNVESNAIDHDIYYNATIQEKGDPFSSGWDPSLFRTKDEAVNHVKTTYQFFDNPVEVVVDKIRVGCEWEAIESETVE